MQFRTARRAAFLTLIAALLGACDDSTATKGDDAGSNPMDSSVPNDASTGTDASTSNDAGTKDASTTADGSMDASTTTDAGSDASVTPPPPPPPPPSLTFSIAAGVTAVRAQINIGNSIANATPPRTTPWTLTELALDPKNTESNNVGTVPDKAANYCDYSTTPATRLTFPSVAGTPDPMVNMQPFYFPFVYTNGVASAANIATGPQPTTPLVGLFDWRPKDTNEAVVAAQSNDNGLTWHYMQTVMEYKPGNAGCPPAVTATNGDDNGYGHAFVLQLPGQTTGTSFLYLLNRADGHIDSDGLAVVTMSATPKYPVWNTGKNGADVNTVATALAPSDPLDMGTFSVRTTTGLLNPDGIMAVVPNTDPTKPTTVLYVQKILNGDATGPTTMPVANRCTAAPFSGKTNHDISNVRLATTMDGINFTDMGIVNGLNDPTTVDYNRTRWIAPAGSLININGDGSKWGLFFSGGNCLDGDSDSFHFIGYAESTDLKNWIVYNDINNPLLSIQPIMNVTNQADGTKIAQIPANPPVVGYQSFFGQRVYGPRAMLVDNDDLVLAFSGYAVQTPSANLLDYRQIGNVTLHASGAIPTAILNANEH